MGIYRVKPWFRGRLRGLARELGRRGASPDQVTSAGLAASVAGGLALASGRVTRRAYLLVPVLAFVRIAANALDGLVAEETGTGRPAGELYNETADRLGDIAFFAGAATVPGVPAALAFGALAAAELASFVGITAKAAGGRRRFDGPMGKPDRMVALGVAGMVAGRRWCRRPSVPVTTALVAVAGGALVTAANRYRWAHQELEAGVGAIMAGPIGRPEPVAPQPAR
ncbi:MAG: CDP-alcohol phosphatidyltransferase family protein [Acidimicrobiales bacterium]